MKLFCLLSLLLPLFSCLSPSDESEFFVTELIPRGGEIEGTLKIDIVFSKPVNRKNISISDIELYDALNPGLITEISDFDINDAGTTLTVYSENAEPERYYRLVLSGKILSEDNLLLSYYYGGNFESEDLYFIRKKKNVTPCIVINEVLSYPNDINTSEFIEIFNCSESEADLRGYYIKVDDNRPQRLLFRNNSFNLAGNSYRTILSDIKDPSERPVIYISGKFGRNGLSNTSLKSIQIFSENGKLLSEFRPFGKAKKGISFERINPHIQSEDKNWGYSVAETGSTPDRENSIFMKDIFPPSLKSVSSSDKQTDIQIEAEFDEEIICESSDCLYLLTADNTRIYGTVEINGKNIIFKPLSRVGYSADYTLFATPSLRDKGGNSYPKDTELAKFRTNDMPSVKLSYPSGYTLPSNTRYFEFLSRDFAMDKEKIYLKGSLQILNMLCIKTDEEKRYLCTTENNPEGPEYMCLFINNNKTDICIYLGEPEETSLPSLTIRRFAQIKDYVYIEADSSVPCLLFADFSYKDDPDETFSYSSYNFMQHFEYKIKIQDAYKEYYADIYCADMFNSFSKKERFSTTPYTDDGISLIINEVLPNPEGADTDGEFIELLNNGSAKILSGLISISDCSEKSIKISKMSVSYILPGQPAIIVSNNSAFFSKNSTCTVLSGADRIIGREIKNSVSETLCIYYNGTLMDYYNPAITPNKEGQSLKRVKRDRYFDSANWSISEIPGGTPCLIY
ncbi:MAG: hypothetical protein N3B13_01505 [Deltaproteobacteria bacterium]|nr:hypothetical protein [Deltaproteobacteria bacterium]